MEKIEEERNVSLWVMGGMALLVGIVTGYGAVFFRLLISVIHNLFFFGQFSFAAAGEHFTPESAWGPLVILVPVVGGMGVVFLVKTFAPEAKGHGVPEVMDAIYYKEGRIRPVVAVVKSFASALSIGSGAAVGREGPIIQIGSSFGSTLGQLTKIAAWQRITLVAAGAGAGIAATFNTPLGAVLFAVELMLPEVSTRTFLPVVIATGTATYIGRVAFGLSPAFHMPMLQVTDLHPVQVSTLLGFVLLGVLCGVASWAFVRLLTIMEFYFERPFWHRHPYFTHAVGMTLLGCMMYGLFEFFGHYYVDGVGYGTIQAILRGDMTGVWLLGLLFVAKLVATTLSLGTGSSGGVFSPSLFMGATLGGAVGALILPLIPGADFSVGDFAVVGMASMVGGSTGAAMTGITMIFEMTRDYNIIVPMIIAVALAVGVRRWLSPENIYTIKLAWRGHFIPKDRHGNMFLVRHANEVMTSALTVLPSELSLHEALQRMRATPTPDGKPLTHIIVEDRGRVRGIVPVVGPLTALEEVRGTGTLGDLADRSFVLTRPEESMFDLFKRLNRRNAERALVTKATGVPKPEDIIGVISKRLIADSVLANFKG
ncbi:chloride channel protein, CIC family [Tistlia consotensis]|uniref:Chloride channel protein, CIC family n=1 Tax=Tistlia consotensis USBA 355 TaxID=560819 RepID=A0A1Y6B7W7_9PROT|nr:chloride channel protein [Tistlia consotensis]SME97642.1 chloride channel protein, CIC family [Tistlia consotensis USBA 355]SNR57002.1 chloride channel protein, CIC family [Tistlia consotensis]